MGRRKFYRGRGGWKGGKFYLGVELIKCIDPNEGEALRRGSTFNPGGGGSGAPYSSIIWFLHDTFINIA